MSSQRLWKKFQLSSKALVIFGILTFALALPVHAQDSGADVERKLWVVTKPGGLVIVSSGAPEQRLIPYKALKFRLQEFADVVVEFVEENGKITAVKQIDPSGEYVSKRN